MCNDNPGLIIPQFMDIPTVIDHYFGSSPKIVRISSSEDTSSISRHLSPIIIMNHQPTMDPWPVIKTARSRPSSSESSCSSDARGGRGGGCCSRGDMARSAKAPGGDHDGRDPPTTSSGMS